MGLLAMLAGWLGRRPDGPAHIRRGQLGERAARRHLEQLGLRFLAANFRSGRGEIDLVFRAPDADCLAFVEVKTRSGVSWGRPADAVDRRKRRRMSATALAYVRQLRTREVRWRFDIVEVLLEDDRVLEVRHLPNAFPGDERHRFF